MILRCGVALVMVAWLAASAGATPRVALVIGADDAVYGEDNATLVALDDAEDAADDFASALKARGGFDDRHVVVVGGGGAEEILKAAKALAKTAAAARQGYVGVPDLFVLYFAGRARDGRLLTERGSISAKDLETIREDVGAQRFVAVFDLMEAAPLDDANATHQKSPLDRWPAEQLGRAGTVWIQSAGPSEEAIDGKASGALFTAALVEALSAAPKGRLGRSFTEVFEDARTATMRAADKAGLRQTPRLRSNLGDERPPTIAFSPAREATLVLDAALEGTFLVSYDDGAFVERHVKAPTATERVRSAFVGRVRVTRVVGDDPAAQPWVELSLDKGETVVIGPPADGVALPTRVRSSGDAQLSVAFPLPKSALRLGLGYGFEGVSDPVLAAQHTARLDAWLMFGAMGAGFGLSYGFASDAVEGLGYDLHQVGVELGAGYAFMDDDVRLDVDFAVGIQVGSQSFDAGASELRISAGGKLGLRLGIPLPFDDPAVVLELRAGAVVRFGSSADPDVSASELGFGPYASLSVQIPIEL